MLDVRYVPHGDSDASRMWAAAWVELQERYGKLDGSSEVGSQGLIASLVGYANGEAVGSVALRFSSDAGSVAAEVKRLYLVPEHRGAGHSRVLMGAAEDAARLAGATRIILETGTLQPEAIGLYERIGYSRIPCYGYYKDSPLSICFEKHLPTRVLVISGSLGAGKTTTAWAVSTLLRERGARHAVIEGDTLAQGDPAPPGDPYNQELLFDSLKAIAPFYRERGWGCIIIPRVVEDDGDRARYSRAFAGPGGPASVGIVRLVASEELRVERLRQREPEGRWLDWALNRTVELEEVLEVIGVEDAAITSDKDVRDVAIEALQAVGW